LILLLIATILLTIAILVARDFGGDGNVDHGRRDAGGYGFDGVVERDQRGNAVVIEGSRIAGRAYALMAYKKRNGKEHSGGKPDGQAESLRFSD
jgi:hypothetical protein